MTVEPDIEDPAVDEETADEPPPPPLPLQARAMRAVLVGVFIVLAAVGAVFAVSDRATNDQIVLHVTHPSSLAPSVVEKAVATAPEPTKSGPRNTKVAAIRCTPGSAGTIRNPWRCRVEFVNRHVVRYVVRIASDGSFIGQRRPTPISGCCIQLPRPAG